MSEMERFSQEHGQAFEIGELENMADAVDLESLVEADVELDTGEFTDPQSMDLDVEEFSDASIETLMDKLDLSEEEKEVYRAIRPQIDSAEQNFSGEVKVKGDCVSTSCVSTTTYVYCAYTGGS